MHLSLYRRYRPSRFSEIAGQEGIVEALLRSLEEGRVSHAYLFSGPRGCGKTPVLPAAPWRRESIWTWWRSTGPPIGASKRSGS